MHDSLLAWTANVMGPVFAEQRSPVPKAERTWGGNAFYNLYETKDGRWLALGASEHKFAENFLAKAGRSDLAPYAHRQPGEQAPLIAYLRQLMKEKTLAEWLAWLDGVDVAYAPVRSLKDAIDDPNTRARGMLLDGRVRAASISASRSGSRASPPSRACARPGSASTRTRS